MYAYTKFLVLKHWQIQKNENLRLDSKNIILIKKFDFDDTEYKQKIEVTS
jgi:hypothetical protein